MRKNETAPGCPKLGKFLFLTTVVEITEFDSMSVTTKTTSILSVVDVMSHNVCCSKNSIIQKKLGLHILVMKCLVSTLFLHFTFIPSNSTLINSSSTSSDPAEYPLDLKDYDQL